MRELLEDERRFVDLSRSPIFLAEEYAIITADDGDSNCAGAHWKFPGLFANSAEVASFTAAAFVRLAMIRIMPRRLAATALS